MIELPKLPYAENALEPVISAETLAFHYGKHHKAYVDNLNKLIPGTPFENASLEEIIMKSEGGIFNNGAQVWNHTFYFNQFSPNAAQKPEGKLMDLIQSSFGSFEAFKEKFTQSAITLFGAGWAWLVINNEGKLEIIQTSNAANPMRNGFKPLLTCDVWEHAYYIDYRNSRPNYLESFWKIFDWKIIEYRL